MTEEILTQTKQVLSRDESADLVQKIWSTMVENAPEDTKFVRTHGALSFIALYDGQIDLHKDHYNWLVAMLSDKVALDLADKFAIAARRAADYTRPTIISDNGDTVPVFWRD